MASGGKRFVPFSVKISKPLQKLKGRLHTYTKRPNDTQIEGSAYWTLLAFRKCDAVVLLLSLHFRL